MKKMIIFLVFILIFFSSYSQTFLTRNGYVGFFSKTPLEDIKAENRQVFAIIDAAKKNLAFTLLVKGFLFQKDLMQQHFNENYVESDKYPKASFNGSYTGNVDAAKTGIYPVQVKGQLSLHGVTKTVDIPGSIEVQGGKLISKADFKVLPSDYNIEIPSLVKEKIAKQIDVRVLVECNPK